MSVAMTRLTSLLSLTVLIDRLASIHGISELPTFHMSLYPKIELLDNPINVNFLEITTFKDQVRIPYPRRGRR